MCVTLWQSNRIISAPDRASSLFLTTEKFDGSATVCSPPRRLICSSLPRSPFAFILHAAWFDSFMYPLPTVFVIDKQPRWKKRWDTAVASNFLVVHTARAYLTRAEFVRALPVAKGGCVICTCGSRGGIFFTCGKFFRNGNFLPLKLCPFPIKSFENSRKFMHKCLEILLFGHL